jgi:hypothetical protein
MAGKRAIMGQGGDPMAQAVRTRIDQTLASRRRLLGGVLGLALALGSASADGQRRHRHRQHTGGQPCVDCDPTGSSGIQGLVLLGPLCPVQSVDNPCPDQPYAATLVVRNEQGQEIGRSESGEDGQFQIDLPPGQYALVPVSGPNGFPHAMPQPVTVEPGQYTEVTVTYDTGIR